MSIVDENMELRLIGKAFGLHRKLPFKREQKKILESQNHCCFYCGLKFDFWFTYKHRSICVTICWDHLIPYAFSRNSDINNFVAACTQCNSIKSDLVFTNLKKLVDYVRQNRKEKGLPMSTVWGNVQTKQKLAKVLFNEMQERVLLGPPRNSSQEGLQGYLKECNKAKKSAGKYLPAWLTD